jgi:CheY-like chemotaxis protein
MLRRLIGEDVRFTIVPAAGPLTARVDRGQFEQVVVNLAVNARDAMPGGGALTIAVEAATLDERFTRQHVESTAGPHICLTVQDTGIGMDEATRSRAFDPFFTTKEQGKGTGLGLSTVYGIVRQSGGSVWLDSEPGLGTTVRVYLPRVGERPPDLALPIPDETVSVSGGTVLVVEDEPLVRDLVARTLRRGGFTVLLADNGEGGLQVADSCEGAIDLLLTDVIMPRMSGPELATRLLTQRPDLRVLLVSGYASESLDLRGALTAGAEFLQKPFTPSVLLARVRTLLAVERPHI